MKRACLSLVLVAMLSVPAAAQQWATVKGQVLLKNAPQPKELVVTVDKAACLIKGPLKDDAIIVNPKNSGFKNVWVYLRPDDDDTSVPFKPEQIHPSLAKGKVPPKEHVIDQPCCLFIPQTLAAREGDTLVVKNTATIPHNCNFQSDVAPFNQSIPANGQYKHNVPLAAQTGIIQFMCNIHPWMNGRMMVFDHPYFAVTDDDGKFEIPNAPVGKFRIFYRHAGYHKGRAGNKGFPLDITGPTLELKPLEFEMPK